jgi:hypothetical protein
MDHQEEKLMSRRTSSHGNKPKNRLVHVKKVQHKAKKTAGRPKAAVKPFLPTEYVGRSLSDVGSTDVGSTGPIKRTTVEQALENWKAVQNNEPWWWLAFNYGNKCAGVVLVQGWTFLDALNTSNRLKLSPIKAGVYGEEMSDMWTPKDGSKREKWTGRLLTVKEANGLFDGVHKVIEADLYKAKDEEVKFTG